MEKLIELVERQSREIEELRNEISQLRLQARVLLAFRPPPPKKKKYSSI
jgi:hypothetical protein